MFDLAAQISSAASFVFNRIAFSPRVGIILGTGLGNFVEQILDRIEIPYREIPHFPDSTAIGHVGQLVCGRLGSVPVAAMHGRCHLYEGHSSRSVTLPIRVMKELGCELLIVSNASGGLNPAFDSGDVMVIEDHVNLMWSNPLMGINDDRLGTRFPDLCAAYDGNLVRRALAVGRANGFTCHQGVYAALTGPNYETRAEYRMLRQLGADVVGMSTVPEVIVAVHAGMRVLGLSAVTNLCRPDTLKSTSGHEVIAAAEKAEPQMRRIVKAIVAELE